MKYKLLRSLFVFAVAVFSAPAYPHELNIGVMKIDWVDGTNEKSVLNITYELNPKTAELLSDVSSKELSNETALKSLARILIEKDILEAVPACSTKDLNSTLIDEMSVQMTATFECPHQTNKTLSFSHLKKANPDLRIFARFNSGTTEDSTLILSAQTTTLTFAAKAPISLGTLFVMGIQHIGAWPDQWYEAGKFHLPEGLDHILFVIILALAAGSIWQVFKSVTGFTLGHTVTLALGAFGIVQWPSHFVEICIALTLCYTALHALIRKQKPISVWVSTLFGLIHGMGFASAITEAGLPRDQFLQSVLAFNIGVEIGQLIILALLFPILTLLAKSKVATPLRAGFAAAVLVVSAYWTFERTFMS